MLKSLPANAGVAGHGDSIPGPEDPLEEEMATLCSILVEKLPWIEEPGGVSGPWGLKELGRTE